MGIKGLKKFLRDRSPQLFKSVSLQMLPKARYALDAEGTVHQIYSIARQRVIQQIDIFDGDPDEELIFPHLREMFINKLTSYAKAGHLLIPVFDGPDKPAKRNTLEKRREQQAKQRNELTKIRNQLNLDETLPDNINQLQSRASKLSAADQNVPRTFIDRLQQQLSSLGIPYLIAVGEGERLCSQLAIDGYALGVVSRDSDCLAHGAPLIISDHKEKPEVVELTELLRHYQITYDQLVDWCILSGCDFNDNLPKIAVVKSLSLIKEHGSIENVIKHLKSTGSSAANDEHVERLNYQQCRQLLKPTDCVGLVKTMVVNGEQVIPSRSSLRKLNWNPPSATARMQAEANQVAHWLDRWHQIELPSYGKYVSRNPQLC